MNSKFGHSFHFISLFIVIANFTITESASCSGKLSADIVFALDSSASIHRNQFNQQLQFVKDVINEFPVSENGIRVGLLTFSYRIYPTFNLSTYSNTKSLQKGIKHAYYAGQGTYTADAIAYTRDVMFSELNGGREHAPNVMILITDGISVNKTATALEAVLAKLRGIKIIVIGVGNGVDKTELQTIASLPTSRFIFNVDSYEKLNTVIKLLSRKACTEAKKQRNRPDIHNTLYTEQNHDNVSDRSHLTFVYDGFGETRKSRLIKKNIGLMVKQFDVSKTKMTFSLLSRSEMEKPTRRDVFLKDLYHTKSKSKRMILLLKSIYSQRLSKNTSQKVIVFLPGKLLRSKKIYEELKRMANISQLYVVNLSTKFNDQYNLCLQGKKCIYTVSKKRPIHDVLTSIKQQICNAQGC